MTDWRAIFRTVAPTVAPGTDDAACCVFMERLTRAAYGDDVVDRAPRALWRLFRDCRDGFATIRACQLAGIVADAVYSSVPADGRWHRVQGWNLLGDADRVTAGELPIGNGHTFMCWRDPKGGPGRTLDSIEHDQPGRKAGPLDLLWPSDAALVHWLSQFRELRSVALADPTEVRA